MKRLIFLCLLALPACKEERAALPQPIEMTAEAVGHYCQMNLLDHAGPKAQVHLEGLSAPLFFSQVRDAVAYLHMPEQSHAVRVVYAQDMSGAAWDAPGQWVELSQLVFVIDSDAAGGMDAPEFVPFADRSAAEAFARDRGGVVLALSEITAKQALGANAQASEASGAPQSDIAARLSALTAARGE